MVYSCRSSFMCAGAVKKACDACVRALTRTLSRQFAFFCFQICSAGCRLCAGSEMSRLLGNSSQLVYCLLGFCGTNKNNHFFVKEKRKAEYFLKPNLIFFLFIHTLREALNHLHIWSFVHQLVMRK